MAPRSITPPTEMPTLDRSPLSRRRFLRLALALPTVGGLALLAACGGQRTAGGADRIVQTTNSRGDRGFYPNHVTVLRGNKVIWENVAKTTENTVTCDPSKTKEAGNVALPKGAQPFDSGQIAPGQVYSYTFTVVGDYTYFSQTLPSMVGHVTVVA